VFEDLPDVKLYRGNIGIFGLPISSLGVGTIHDSGVTRPGGKRATLFQKSSLWLTCGVGCR
jgi:hypothetical protein